MSMRVGKMIRNAAANGVLGAGELKKALTEAGDGGGIKPAERALIVKTFEALANDPSVRITEQAKDAFKAFTDSDCANPRAHDDDGPSDTSSASDAYWSNRSSGGSVASSEFGGGGGRVSRRPPPRVYSSGGGE